MIEQARVSAVAESMALHVCGVVLADLADATQSRFRNAAHAALTLDADRAPGFHARIETTDGLLLATGEGITAESALHELHVSWFDVCQFPRVPVPPEEKTP